MTIYEWEITDFTITPPSGLFIENKGFLILLDDGLYYPVSNFDELNKTVTFDIANRNGFLNKNYAKMQTLNVDVDISSTKLRDTLDLNFIPHIIQEDVKHF